MSEPIRRRRRRRKSDESDLDISLLTRTKSSPIETEIKSDDPPSNEPEVTVDFNTASHQATLDRIRSEIDEDQYHSQLSEPDYEDNTHDWGNDSPWASSDYWHFLGRYE